LTLEYLEAEFYRQALARPGVSLPRASREIVETIGGHERAHVAAILDTIGKLNEEPVDPPVVDFGEAFTTTKGFLQAAHDFENTGVAAYLGAARFIEDKAILQSAAQIAGVEARHAALIGELLGLKPEGGVFIGAVETLLEKDQVLSAVAPFIKS
jgi:rubrerythrin